MIDALLRLNDAAQVLGYFVMATWAILLIWLICKMLQEVRFDWRRKRMEEREWDLIREKWIENLKTPREDVMDDVDRHDTDVLGLVLPLQRAQDPGAVPETRPYETVYDYQKELQGERPQRAQGGRTFRRR